MEFRVYRQWQELSPAVGAGVEALLEEAFPAEERRDMEEVRQLLGKTSLELLTLEEEDRVQGLLMLWNLEGLMFLENFAVDAYDALQPYLTTSMAKGQLVNEAWAAKDYTRLDTIKPDGTYQVGEDGFMEFYPDADALQQAVLQLFYEKVE